MAVVFLTGASSGLGAALAPLLAADGDVLILAARREAPLRALTERICAAGGQAEAVVLDVGDRAAVFAAIQAAEARHGAVETLILNAGISRPTPASGFDGARVEQIIRTNVLGAAYCVEAALPAMRARGRGHIVGISSLAGYRGLPGSAAYSASKAALTNLLESLRVELQGTGVDVSVICPGFIKTPLTDTNTFKMPFLMETADGAAAIYAAIRARRRHAAFPWQLASLARLGRVLPHGLYDRIFKGRRLDKHGGGRG